MFLGNFALQSSIEYCVGWLKRSFENQTDESSGHTPDLLQLSMYWLSQISFVPSYLYLDCI